MIVISRDWYLSRFAAVDTYYYVPTNSDKSTLITGKKPPNRESGIGGVHIFGLLPYSD